MGSKGMFKDYKIRLENDYSPEICAIRGKLVEYLWERERERERELDDSDKDFAGFWKISNLLKTAYYFC